MLLLVVEKLSTAQRMRQLRLHAADGALVGQLILDGGMVSCGVQVNGAIYIDDEFRRDAAPISSILSKVLLGEAISFEETARVQAIPLVARRALCQVTARALRHLSVLCDLAQIRIADLPGASSDGRNRSVGGGPGPAVAAGVTSHSPAGSSANPALRFVFSPVDLLLAAGRSGRFREADAAAKIYEVHPEPLEERWLFQWQSHQIGEAWPVMTTRQSDKQTNTVAQFGLLGQNLVQRFAIAQRSGNLRGTAAELAATDDHLYYVVLTDHYVTLLVYQKQQLERVLRSFQDLVFDTPYPPPPSGVVSPMAQAAVPAAAPTAVAGERPQTVPASPAISSAFDAVLTAMPAVAFASAVAPAPVVPSAPSVALAPVVPSAPSVAPAPVVVPAATPAPVRGAPMATPAPIAAVNGPAPIAKGAPPVVPTSAPAIAASAPAASPALTAAPAPVALAGSAVTVAPAVSFVPVAPPVPLAPPVAPAPIAPPVAPAPIAPLVASAPVAPLVAPAPVAPLVASAPVAAPPSVAPIAATGPAVSTVPSGVAASLGPGSSPKAAEPQMPAVPVQATAPAPASPPPRSPEQGGTSARKAALPESTPRLRAEPALPASEPDELPTAPRALAWPSGPVSLDAPSADMLPRASAVTLGELLPEPELPAAAAPPGEDRTPAPSHPVSAVLPPRPVEQNAKEPGEATRERAAALAPTSSPPPAAKPEVPLSAAPQEAVVPVPSVPVAVPEPPPRSGLAPAVRVDSGVIEEAAESPRPHPPPEAALPGPPVLRIVGLTVECDHQVVLRNIDLELGARGLYALTGGAGAGKSALLGVLSGRNRAASGWQLEGSIWYCNLPLGATTRPAVLTSTVSRPSLSLRGYLLADLDELAADSASNGFLLDLLDRVALSALAPYLSETLGGPRLRLSTAEWRRVAIARELAASPPLLCVDDAFMGLDAENSAVLRTVLLSAACERAVLFTGSAIPPGLPLAQAFQLRDGQLLERDGEDRPSAVKVRPDAPDKPVSGPAQASGSDVALRVAPMADPASPATSSGAGEDGVPASASRPRLQQGSAPAGSPRKGPDAVIWSSTAPILRLRNFGILASGRPVLVGVNLDLPDCGLHLLIGRDGSQRRMLLRALCGPRGGQLQCTGDALFGGGALSEEHGLTTLLPNPRMAMLTAREHLMQGPSPWQASARQERALRPLRLLEQAGFPELVTSLDTPLYDLGTYERRIIEILASVACSPLALALQDILSGVETVLQPRLLRLLADQAARRAILLFTEEPQPYMAFAFTPPACVAWLHNDRILAEPPE